ncbi:sigma-70 family RNA polymerase sigma factor [Amycolatopsis vastitatis]|uniref:RNA polymerase sigma factor n=1 Tax=Amycolatopsis vastitatis TaxID=1905142 RepID=A0A229TB87_9PSEU|nr:sigma-70 family RNA polymerase sigma factor [Amycolatopsis vastitatis]OXM68517.1 RNA polymerase subunit sigma-70 [Amycolatopsis vastitatis]
MTETQNGNEDFGRLSEPFRRELLAYCYRLLGSVDEAEEVVQDVYLDAWRAYGGFEGRSSLRTWLYRIATRACFKALEKSRHRPLPADLGSPETNLEARLVEPAQEVPWLQPAPDLLFAATPADPATVVVQRQTMRLALIGALQRLPPRQRAVLILRDVLQWRTAEVAELLEMTTAAVTSALQRARAQVPLEEGSLAEPAEPRQRALLDRYVTAFETADVDQLVAVLTQDARWEMPPITTWFEGRDTVLAFLAKQMPIIGPAEVVATAANGQPAFAVYTRGHDGARRPHALHVLTTTAEGVSRIVAFHGSALFPRFGL